MAMNSAKSGNFDQMTSGHVLSGSSRHGEVYPSASTSGLVASVATFLLLFVALLREPGAIEIRFFEAVRGLEPGLITAFLGIGSLTSSAGFILIAWLALLLAAGVSRRWGAVTALSAIPFAIVFASIFERLLSGRIAPDPSALNTSFLASLPNTPVIAATLLFGFALFFGRAFGSQIIRWAAYLTSIVAIVTIGLWQVWSGLLWPVDVLAGFLMAVMFLISLLIVARYIDAACANLPLVHAADVEHDESLPHTRALTSTVVFNGDTVSKIYRPGFVPRAVYWMAFQAEFPYMRNEAALQAAVHRRNLIGQLTEYWYGSSRVARALGIETIAGRFAITSEFIDGSPPQDRDAARRFMEDLFDRFDAAGLPTWQIDPRQPRALDNLLETPDGTYCVVDLESGLVAPLASMRAWRRAFQRGLVPMYDDMFFDVTRSYITRHEDAMRAKFGDEWVSTLHSTLDRTEALTQTWQNSEPRIWSRLFGRKQQKAAVSNGRVDWAIDWLDGAIETWRSRRWISAIEAAQLKRNVRSPEFLAVMPHLAVHLSTGLLLRFPLGSIARAGYTTFHLLRESVRRLRGDITHKEWKRASGIHSPLVILFAAIPGFGAFSYLASKPIRSDQLLLRIGLDAVLLKLPFKIYERTRLRQAVVHMPEFVERAGSILNRQPKVPGFLWADQHRSGADLIDHPGTVEVATGLCMQRII